MIVEEVTEDLRKAISVAAKAAERETERLRPGAVGEFAQAAKDLAEAHSNLLGQYSTR